MRPALRAILATAAIATAPAALAAQSNPVELGLDAGLTVQLGDTRVTTFGIPLQAARANFFLGNTWSLETRLGFTRTSVENGGSSSALNLEIGPMVNFGNRSRYGTGRAVPDWYFRPALLVAYNSVNPRVGDGASNTDLGIAGAVGTRIPLMAQHLALRLEGQVGKFNDASDPFLGLTVGLSFFTR
jgi:hypothetical protein